MFILTSAGKPVFMRHGKETELIGLICDPSDHREMSIRERDVESDRHERSSQSYFFWTVRSIWWRYVERTSQICIYEDNCIT